TTRVTGDDVRASGLRRGGSRLSGLRIGQPPQRERQILRLPAGSGPRRQEYMDTYSDRLRQDDVQSETELGVLYRPRSPYAEPQNLLASRENAGRVQLDQRADLCSRAKTGLRPLGRAGE